MIKIVELVHYGRIRNQSLRRTRTSPEYVEGLKPDQVTLLRKAGFVRLERGCRRGRVPPNAVQIQPRIHQEELEDPCHMAKEQGISVLEMASASRWSSFPTEGLVA
jgi:hypothetical protein